jgi:hypothetical protein
MRECTRQVHKIPYEIHWQTRKVALIQER